MEKLIILYTLFAFSFCQQDSKMFLKALNLEAYEWVGIPESTLDSSLEFCNHQLFQQELMELIHQLQHTNENLTTDSLRVIQQAFKNAKTLREGAKCLAALSHTRVHFLDEKRKLATMKNYLTEYPQYSANVFNEKFDPEHKGKQLGKWIKGFMEYYYVTHVSEAETLSTVLLRSLATKTHVLENRDFSFCIDLESAGKMSEELQNVDINNIFLRIPSVFDCLKYLSLKEKCLSESNTRILKNLHSKIKDINMFKIMYYDYQPYVAISTQKYGISKIKLLATCFSRIINNAEDVRREQILRLQEEEAQLQERQRKKEGQL